MKPTERRSAFGMDPPGHWVSDGARFRLKSDPTDSETLSHGRVVASGGLVYQDVERSGFERFEIERPGVQKLTTKKDSAAVGRPGRVTIEIPIHPARERNGLPVRRPCRRGFLCIVVNECAGVATFQVENVDVEVADEIAGEGDALTVGEKPGT